MASKLKIKKTAPREKLLMLRSLADSKSVWKNSIILDAYFYICMLELKLEALKREYLTLITIMKECQLLMKFIRIPEEVKVEKAGKGYVVKVTCEKAKDKLVSILEAFENTGLNVLQARVNSSSLFSMDAIAVPQCDNDNVIDMKDVTRALYDAIGKKEGKDT